MFLNGRKRRGAALAMLLTLMLAVAAGIAPRTRAFAEGESLPAAYVVRYRQNLTESGALSFYLYAEGNAERIAALTSTTLAQAKGALASALTDAAQELKVLGRGAETDGERLTVTLGEFSDFTQYYIAMGIDGYEKPAEEEREKVRAGYYTYYIDRTDTPFAAIEGTITELLIERGEELGIARSEMRFVYEYATKYSQRAIRSDADEIYEESGMTVHRFVMTEGERGREITLIQRVPESWVWYVTAMAVAIVLGAIAWVGYAVYKRRKQDADGNGNN